MICQVARTPRKNMCRETESGGMKCERPKGHDGGCKISEHTIEHALAGNGYACSAMRNAPVETLP